MPIAICAQTRATTAKVDSPKLKVFEKKTKRRISPIEASGPSQTRKRCQLKIQKDTDDEETESDNLDQYKIVSTKIEVDILCD